MRDTGTGGDSERVKLTLTIQVEGVEYDAEGAAGVGRGVVGCGRRRVLAPPCLPATAHRRSNLIALDVLAAGAESSGHCSSGEEAKGPALSCKSPLNGPSQPLALDPRPL